jgi:hypothetical protein
LQLPDSAPARKAFLEKWSPYSLVRNQVVLPICQGNLRKSTSEVTFTPIHAGPGYASSRAMICPRFGVALAFAITVTKAQGQTMSHIILAWSKGATPASQLSYAHVYTSISHMRNANNIRLLLNGSTEQQQWSSMAYMEQLQPDPCTVAYFQGYSSDRAHWESDDWNPERALQAWNHIAHHH